MTGIAYDYSQYSTWEKVVAPNGAVYYKVPDTGYLYDPFLSQQKGRPILWTDPRPEAEKKKAAEDQQRKQQKKQEDAASPIGQLGPVLTGTAAVVGGQYLINHSAAPTAQGIIQHGPQEGNVWWSDGKITTPSGQVVSAPGSVPNAPANMAPVNTPVQAPAPTAGDAFTQSAAPAPAPGVNSSGAPQAVLPPGSNAAPVQIGVNADGSPIMQGPIYTNELPPGATVAPDGSIFNSDNLQIGQRIGQGALGAYQIYQGAKKFKDDKIAGGLDVVGGGANVVGAIAPETGAGAVAGPVMTAKGAYDFYGATQHGGEGLRTSTTEIGAGIGTMLGGFPGTVMGAAAGNAIGYGLQDNGWKNDAVLLAGTGGMAAPYVLARHMGFDPLQSIMHKTTGQFQQEHTGQLLKDAGEDANAQAYVQGMRQGFNGTPIDKKNPFGDTKGNKYASWDDYVTGGLDAANLTGVYGNIKTYGPKEWAALTEDQRRAITQANIDSNLYTSKKGEVEITDETKAKENYDNVMKGFQVGTNTQAAATGTTPVAGAAPPVGRNSVAPPPGFRTSTVSPGIDMNGHRVAIQLANRLNKRR